MERRIGEEAERETGRAKDGRGKRIEGRGRSRS